MKRQSKASDREQFAAILSINNAIFEQVETNRKPLEQVLKVSKDDVSCMEAAADRLIQVKDFQQASDAYFFLATLNPSESRYWLNLGLAERENGNHSAAIEAFSQATLVDIGQPEAQLHLAEILFDIDRLDEAKQALTLAAELINRSKEFKCLKPQALKLREALRTKQGEGSKANG